MMSRRIKILLAVLAAGAGLTFWYVASYSLSGQTADISGALSQISSTSCAGTKDLPNCDDDNDGLTNAQEAYWGTDPHNPDTDGDGFTDGEEVLTGHNPLVKGPNDLLDNKANLTQRASALILGGIAAGDLDTSNPQYQQAVGALVDQMFAQYTANTATEPDSLVVASGSLDNVISYGIQMNVIFKTLFADIPAHNKSFMQTLTNVPFPDMPALATKHPEQYKAFVAAATAESAAFTVRINQIKSVHVPTQMAPFHRTLLAYLRGMQQQYTSVSKIKTDPVMGLISLQVLRTLATTTPIDLITTFQKNLNDSIQGLTK